MPLRVQALIKKRAMRCTRLPQFLPSLSALVFLLCFEEYRSVPIVNDNTVAYLKKFGYLEMSGNYKAGSASSEAAVTGALLEFQRFAGIKQTGELDSATLEMMTVPRCGVKDISEHSQLTGRRKKRYALQGSRWRVNRLTYRISKYPSRIKDRQLVDNAIAQGFKLWSDVTQLNFEERKTGNVDIEIKFEVKDHGDGDPFDGPGKTLAHAFFPQYGGDAHFDDEETWTIDEASGIDILQIATHEFGHSLGLYHSDERTAVMTPFYTAYRPSFSLHSDDITGIQAIYGDDNSCVCNKPTDDDEPSCPSDTSGAPDLCQDSTIDAATRTRNGNTYVFKGNFYWKILSNGIADGYPRRISDDWGGMPGNLDAALTWSNGKTYFFKGGSYWSFTNRRMDEGYPKSISVGFQGIPDDLDAAFTWSGNGEMYFFKGDKYWKYDSNSNPPVPSDYPLPVNLWNGIPNNIDAAVQWENNKTYFFKGDQYYRFNDTASTVDTDPQYPLSTSIWWFDCKSTAKIRLNKRSANLNGEFNMPSPDPNLRLRSSPI